MHPRPSALRLSTPAPQSKQPRPPFGLREWSTEGHAAALLLDARHGDLQSVASVVAQVPRASTLPSGTPIVLLGTAVRAAGGWRHLFGGGTAQVTRPARCTALVVAGYIDVGGGVDEATAHDLAWGWSP
jgi:hypothetical protein